MLARGNPEMAFYTLNQYLDYEWVRYAYECTRKDGAVGVDDQTAEDYAANLEQNLLNLVDQLQIGPLPSAAGSPTLHPEIGWQR